MGLSVVGFECLQLFSHSRLRWAEIRAALVGPRSPLDSVVLRFYTSPGSLSRAITCRTFSYCFTVAKQEIGALEELTGPSWPSGVFSSNDNLEKESQWWETSVLWAGSCFRFMETCLWAGSWKGVGKSAYTRSCPLSVWLLLAHLELTPGTQGWGRLAVLLCSPHSLHKQ